ncbi:MAG: hypothetical protein IPJ45_17540 [Ignavibacteria bacterium]|nr:hypothetical protein [Ignavibacteria bacterium]
MTSVIKGLIVDDELSGRENLKILIESYCTEIKLLVQHHLQLKQSV